MEDKGNIKSNKRDLKDIIDIDFNVLPINYDILWQDKVKEIFKVNKTINLDNILIKINLEQPVNKYILFFRDKKYEFNNSDKNNKRNNFLNLKEYAISKWKNIDSKEKECFIKPQNNIKNKFI